MSLESEPQASDSAADAQPPQLPPPPRPLTPRVRRRSWAELPVRPWIILALTSTLVCLFFLVTRVREAMNDRWLIDHGINIPAKFLTVNGDPVRKRYPRNEAMAAVVTFDWQGKPYQLSIPRLEAKPGGYAVVGETLPIKVDPNDPTRWTEETTAKPWSEELTAVGLLLPLAAIAFIVLVMRRRAILNTWMHEPLLNATVIETRQSGAAPMSRIVRFTLNNEPDRRIWTMLIPVSAGIPAKGESIWLVCPPKNPSRAILARLYQDGDSTVTHP